MNSIHYILLIKLKNRYKMQTQLLVSSNRPRQKHQIQEEKWLKISKKWLTDKKQRL